MSNRTDKNEIIVSPINDDRLKTGMNRTRSGSTQLFGGTTHEPEITLTPPEKHLYALEVRGVWMWVNGCGHCNQNGEKISYVVCEEHDRCQCCGVNRKDAITIPPRSENDIGGGVWGSRDANGFGVGHAIHAMKQKRKKFALRLLRGLRIIRITTSGITSAKMRPNAHGAMPKLIPRKVMTLMATS